MVEFKFEVGQWEIIFPNATELEMYSDASFSDKGVFCDGVRIGGPWKGLTKEGTKTN